MRLSSRCSMWSLSLLTLSLFNVSNSLAEESPAAVPLYTESELIALKINLPNNIQRSFHY